MRKIIKFFTGIVMLSAISTAADLSVIPTPQSVQFRPDSFGFTGLASVQIILDDSITSDDEGVNILREAIANSFGIQTNVVRVGDKSAPASIFLVIASSDTNANKKPAYDFTPEMTEEGYFLDISPNKITVAAQNPTGLFYGLMTLTQMIRSAEKGKIPCVLIQDFPSMKWRGVSDDFSRGQVSTMDNFKQIIRFLAENKINVFVPYMEDVIQLEKYPDIGMGRGALSKDEIREIQAYAKRLHVQIVPVFQTLGHFENILTMPNYGKFAEYPGAGSLNSTNPESDKFLFDLLDEVIPLFESEYFHIGADESWDVGLGANRDLVAKEGVSKIHARHYQKVYDKVKSYGKNVMMYGDIILRHPDILNQIPKDIIIVDWHYSPTDNYPSIKQFADSGFQVIVSPGIQNWLNVIPNYDAAWINISNINLEGYKMKALGSINSTWGDYGGPNFREWNYLGYAYGAESSWNTPGMDGETINRRFFRQFFGCEDSRLSSLLIHLNEIPNLTNFKEIFRQPFFPTDESAGKILIRSRQLVENGNVELSLIDDLRPVIKTNVYYLDYFEFAAKMSIFMGERLKFTRDVSRIEANKEEPTLTENDWNLLQQNCTALIENLNDLEHSYKSLWLRTNRPDNLSRVLNLFRVQMAYFETTRESLFAHSVQIPITLTSKFITSKQNPDSDKPAPAFLRKTFELERLHGIKSANLQMIANSEASISINGKSVGRITATKSLSLLVENQRIGWWDVLDKLEKGKNIITVTVQGYKPRLPSIANVYLELQFEDGRTIVVQSDGTWEAATQVKDGWQLGRDTGGKWNSALIFDKYPWRISAPMFGRGFASQIEF